MSKTKSAAKPAKPAKPATKTPEAAKPAEAAKPEAKVPTIQVLRQPEKPYRKDSARDLYWQAVQAHNGKTVKELADSIAAAAPSQPKRGKLAGQTEPLSGWLAWFKAQGVLAIG